MNFLDAWSHIEISSIRKNEAFQFFDNKIRIIYSLLGSVRIQRNDVSTILGNDDFFILTNANHYDISQTKGKVYCFTLDYFRDNMEEIDYIFQGDSVNKDKRTDFEVSQFLKQLLLLVAISAIYRVFQVFLGLSKFLGV